MRKVFMLIGLALATALAWQPASAQNAVFDQVQYGGVLCRIGPDAANRFRGGQRDCTTNNVRGGICYCSSPVGPLEGNVIRGYGGGYGGGGYGGGYGGYEGRRGPARNAVCRIPSGASQFTGGRRDCPVYGGSPGGGCSCPSDRGPIRGRVVILGY